jgi:peptide/nickel transport system ATP-binding protein
MRLSDERFRREVQWLRISMVMQAAMNALNPVVRVGEQVAEPLRVHRGWSRARALARAAEVFSLVGVSADFLSATPSSSPAACASGRCWPWPWSPSRTW